MRRSTPFEPDPGLAETRNRGTEFSELRRQAMRARRFLILAIAWGGAIAFWPVAVRSGAIQTCFPFLADGEAETAGVGMVIPLLVLSGLYIAFLISKTAQSIGLTALPAFMIALFPPLWPLALGRMVRKNVLLVYGFLLTDAIVLTGAWVLNRTTPWIFCAVFLLLTPLAIYHLLGCAVADLATLLGYNRYLAVIWVCGMPYLIFAALVGTMGAQGFWNLIQAAGEPLTGYHELVGWYRVSPVAQTLLFAWPLLGLFFWLRAIHENLKYPLHA